MIENQIDYLEKTKTKNNECRQFSQFRDFSDEISRMFHL